MKKKYIWAIITVFVLNFLLPLWSAHYVLAEDQGTGLQTILKMDNLSISAKPTVSESQVEWQIHYERTAGSANDFQRLKMRLLINGEEQAFPSQNGWEELSENWIAEKSFAKESKGNISFITDANTKQLQVEVQLDQADSAVGDKESIIQNVLESKYQGPFDLKIPTKTEEEIPTKTEKSDSKTQISTEISAGEDSQESISNSSESTVTSSSSELEDSSSQSYASNFGSLEVNIRSLMTTRAAYSYTDPFTYTNQDGNQYPTLFTNQYLKNGEIFNNNADTIRNFDYGASHDNPKTTNVISGNQNFLNGYHTYYNTKNPNSTDSAILTKKTISPTTNPNEFNVQVDVVGGASEIKKPVDVVFVIDKSGSMAQDLNGKDITNGANNSNSKWQILKRTLTSFAGGLLTSDNDIRMSVVGFGSDYSNRRNTAVWAESSKFSNGSSFTTNSSQLLQNTIVTTNPGISGTPTYLGVDLGAKVLKDEGRSNAEKYLIVLTDGVPTFYAKNNKGISSANWTSSGNKNHYSLASGNFDGDGIKPNPTQTINYVQNQIYSNSAMASVVKYGIGFGTNNDNDVANVLTAIAGGDSNRVLNANSNNDLQNALELIKRDITGYTDSFQLGTLSDPMSPYVDLVGDSTSVKLSALSLTKGFPSVLSVIPDTDESFPDYAEMIKENKVVSSQDGTTSIQLSQMNLGAVDNNRHGIRINYIVQLKPEYRDGKFYPANGPTSAKAFNYDSAVGFAVPSIRSETFSINVEKIWQGDSKYLELRKDITLQLQQKIGNSGDWKNVDGQTVMIAASATGDALKGKFSNLPAVSIKEKSDGSLDYQQIYYRVIESNRVPGYKDPVIAPNDGITIDSTNKNVTITNTLMTTNLDFTKVDEAGKALNGAEFTLYRKVNGNPQEFNRITNPTDGKFRFENLPIGEYILKETVTPSGFSTRADAEFSVKDSASGTPSITVTKGSLDDDSSKDGNQLLNQLIPFTLAIVKQDAQSNKKLENVSFSLSDKNTGNEVATMKTGTDGTGHFLDGNQNPLKLETGKTYVIKETDTLDGYILDKRPIEVTVNADGSLTVTRDGEPYKNYSKENQEIQVRIDNQKKGLLPSTGGNGSKMFIIFAGACLVLALALSGVYIYRNWKEVHR